MGGGQERAVGSRVRRGIGKRDRGRVSRPSQSVRDRVVHEKSMTLVRGKQVHEMRFLVACSAAAATVYASLALSSALYALAIRRRYVTPASFIPTAFRRMPLRALHPNNTRLVRRLRKHTCAESGTPDPQWRAPPRRLRAHARVIKVLGQEIHVSVLGIEICLPWRERGPASLLLAGAYSCALSGSAELRDRH